MSCLVPRLLLKPPQWVKEDRKEETLSLLKAGNGYNHTSHLPIPKGQCQGRTRALQGLAVSEAAPPPSLLSPFPPWVHPCPWV